MRGVNYPGRKALLTVGRVLESFCARDLPSPLPYPHHWLHAAQFSVMCLHWLIIQPLD